jgi:polyhydroxybutyrate depolymerase
MVDQEQFIGIYPQGVLNSWNDGSGGAPSTADDVGFTLEVLARLGEVLELDDDRVYSAGYSNGGSFSYLLARSTDVFAAVASMSASHIQGLVIAPNVTRVSVMQLHGDQDPVVPYEGGSSIILPIGFESALSTVQAWALHDGLSGEPVITEPEARTTLYTFGATGSRHEVRLYRLHGATHDISTHDFCASGRCFREIWAFFDQHPPGGP